MPRGSVNAAAVPMPFIKAEVPLPAIVVTTPAGVIFITVRVLLFVIYMLLDESIAIEPGALI